MDRITEIFHRALPATQDDGRGVVWRQTTRLGVYPHQVECLPHLLDELIDVEPFFRGDWDGIRYLVEEVELFY